MAGHPDADSTDLALRAQRGDRAAFAALYDRHATGIARALATFVGPQRDLVDDLVQEVFLRVIERLTAYDPSRPFEQWLFTVAINVGRNHARSRRRRREIPMEERRGPETGWPVEDRTLAEMDLVRSIAELAPELRDVVALRIGSDLSFGEIGVLLGIPTGTARRRMHTATRRLRSRMESESKQRSTHERS